MPSRADKKGSLPAGREEARAAPWFPSRAGHGKSTAWGGSSGRDKEQGEEGKGEGEHGSSDEEVAMSASQPCVFPTDCAKGTSLSPFLLGHTALQARQLHPCCLRSGLLTTVSVTGGYWILPCWD